MHQWQSNRNTKYRYEDYTDSKSLLCLLRQLSTDATRICRWAPAPAPRRPQRSIDISCPWGAQQQTHRPPLLLSIDRTERRTDGRTDARSFNRPCTAYGSASKQRHRLTLTVTSDFTTASRKEHTRCSSTVINHCPAVEWLLAAFKRHYALRLAIAPEFFYCSYMCLMFALGC